MDSSAFTGEMTHVCFEQHERPPEDQFITILLVNLAFKYCRSSVVVISFGTVSISSVWTASWRGWFSLGKVDGVLRERRCLTVVLAGESG